MQDIDFDELDRAVNSLIGDTPATAKIDNNPTAQPVAVNVNTTPALAPAPDNAEPTPVSINVAVNTTPEATLAFSTPEPTPIAVSPAIITKPTPAPVQVPSNLVSNRPNLGRSMDMVRPIGGNIATTSPTKTTVLPNPSEVPSRKSMVINPISLTELPPTNNPADRNNNQPIIPIGGSVAESASIVDSQQDSPFIPDVKVDKRPLGGSIEPDMPEQTKEQPPVYASAITPSGFINDKAEISTDMPLPAELQNKLLEIESAEPSAIDTPVIADVPVNPVPPILNVEENVANPPIATPTEKPVVAISPKTTPITPPVTSFPQSGTVPPTSISQQYANTTAENVNLQTTGAIYDTSVYNNKSNIKPLKKKSSAWVWILTAILILIGAAIGVAIYYVVR